MTENITKKKMNPKRGSSSEAYSDWDFGIISNNKNGDLLGFYNKITDITLCRPKYSDVREFKNGFAAVQKSGKWGFINKEGKQIIDTQYESVEDFDNGFAIVCVQHEYSWGNCKEARYLNEDDEDPCFYLHNNYGIINELGTEIAPIIYDEIRKQKQSIYAVFQRYNPLQSYKEEGWSFVDSKGNTITNYKYFKVEDFCEGHAAVCDGIHWGFINKKGKVIIPLIYDFVHSFSENLAFVLKYKKCGFINKANKLIIPIKYENAYDFCKESAAVQLERKWGFINKTGRIVTRLKFDHVSIFHNEGFSLVKLNSKWGFVNQDGKEITAIRYDSVMEFSEGLAAVEQNNRWGFINKDGLEVIPLEYDSVTNFMQSRSVVRLNNKFGIINTKGRKITAIKYDSAYPFENDKRHFNFGKAQVNLDNKIGFIDYNGNEEWPES